MESYTDMTPREAVEYAHGANAFPAGFPEAWEIESKHFSNNKRDDALGDAKAYARDMRKDGWTVKRKSYSIGVAVTCVRKR